MEKCLKLFILVILLLISAFVLKQGHLKLTQLQDQETNFTTQTLSSLSPNRTLEKYFLVFVIPSLPAHVGLRNAIRQTWSNVSSWSDLLSGVQEHYKRIKVMFIFGSEHQYSREFEQELVLHNDDMFIVDNLIEHRESLKYKVMWGMQQALHRYEFSYFIKTDDDIVVNLPLLITELITLPREHYNTGNCYMLFGGFSGYPIWYYCSGGGYVLTRDVVHMIQQLPSTVHEVQFRPEDAYIGYLVAKVRKLLGYRVQRENKGKLCLTYYKCGLFVKWFYHRASTVRRHVRLHDRISRNDTILCDERR